MCQGTANIFVGSMGKKVQIEATPRAGEHAIAGILFSVQDIASWFILTPQERVFPAPIQSYFGITNKGSLRCLVLVSCNCETTQSFQLASFFMVYHATTIRFDCK